MIFVAKKVLGKLLMPLPFGFIILLLALFIYWRGFHRIAKVAVIGVLSIWYLLSLHPVASMLIEPLENQYSKYDGVPVSFVIVLGGYHRSDERFPVSSLLSQPSLMRLTEGVRIYRLNPGAKLMLSGYKGRDEISNAEAMARVAQSMGVSAEDIVLKSSPKDTAQEAEAWARHVKGERFALVTSAMHMPRAVHLFINQGLKPIPAPTAYHSGGHHDYNWDSWIPRAGALKNVERAWHEYLGIIWAKLRS